MKQASSTRCASMSCARCSTRTGPGPGRARTYAVSSSVGTQPANSMSKVAGGNASTPNSNEMGSKGASSARLPACEAGAFGIEADGDLLHDRDRISGWQESDGGLRALECDVADRWHAAIPVGVRVLVEMTDGDEGFDAVLVGLAHPRP